MMFRMSLDMFLLPLVVGHKVKEIDGTPNHYTSKHYQKTMAIAAIPRSRKSKLGYSLS